MKNSALSRTWLLTSPKASERRDTSVSWSFYARCIALLIMKAMPAIVM